MTNPCIGCVPPKRTCTCHDQCEAYKKWKQEHDENTLVYRKAQYIEWIGRNERRKSRK